MQRKILQKMFECGIQNDLDLNNKLNLILGIKYLNDV